MQKYILGVMHPRRLSYFLESINKIDYVDIVFAKNMEIVKALNTLKNYTLEHSYDYLILTSDDVIIPYNSIAKLIADIELNSYKILTGLSVIEGKIFTGLELVNITLNPPLSIERKIGKMITAQEYGFLRIRDVNAMLINGYEIVKVWFVGWSLTAIHRSILEKVEFRPWTTALGWNMSCDLAFSYDTWKMGIEKYCDLTIQIPHRPTYRNLLLVGREPEDVEFKPRTRNLSIETANI